MHATTNEPPEPAYRCGWFESSHELRNGLQVRELPPAELEALWAAVARRQQGSSNPVNAGHRRTLGPKAAPSGMLMVPGANPMPPAATLQLRWLRTHPHLSLTGACPP